MTLRRAILLFALGLMTAGLLIAYSRLGSLLGLSASVLVAAAWLACFAFARSVTALNLLPVLLPFCLFASVALTVVGLLLGAPPLLMLVLAALSLAVWDLVALDMALSVGRSGAVRQHREADTTRRYERRHLHALALALVCGLSLALSARLMTIHIPFVIVLALVVALIVALNRIWALIDGR